MFASFRVFNWFELQLLPIFLVLAAFFGTFEFYRLIHKRACYKEFIVFDCFLLSIFFGFLTGRLSFVIFNYEKFLGDYWRILNFLSYPGIAVFIAIFTSSLFFYLLLARHKMQNLELLDYWARATALGLVFYHLGTFFDGSAAGFLTDSWVGMVFPNIDAKVHPTQLYNAAFYLLIFYYLGYLEKNYRTFNWYRGSHSSVRTGFVFIAFTMIYSLFSLAMLIFTPAMFSWRGWSLDWVFYLLLLFFSLILLLFNRWNQRK